ncbi:MAG: sugar phosphate isomerase/epimerase [Gemmatimonadaceae bacterium]|nr:sugar phosphate isomerase/epimerase [Gemmatimonadaceae bacterium]
MQRRSFLAAFTAGTAGLVAAQKSLAWAATPSVLPNRLDRIGIELYAVRKAMKADPERTLAALRAIGYTDVELLWSFKNFGRSTKEVRDTLKKEGLKAPSAHMAPETILTDWEQSLDTARQLGHQYLIVPSLPAETNKSLDAWKLWANRFNSAGEVARRAGIWLAFHNEPNHQAKLQGEVPLEVFANALDPKYVRLQLDCGNMLMGGGDPMDFLSRHRSMCWSFHLKNVKPDRSSDTELATGTFNLKAFLAAIPDLAKKPCFVEQEGPTDEMASAKQNFDYLKGLEF